MFESDRQFVFRHLAKPAVSAECAGPARSQSPFLNHASILTDRSSKRLPAPRLSSRMEHKRASFSLFMRKIRLTAARHALGLVSLGGQSVQQDGGPRGWASVRRRASLGGEKMSRCSERWRSAAAIVETPDIRKPAWRWGRPVAGRVVASFVRCDLAACMVEHAVILALVFLAVAAGAALLGQRLQQQLASLPVEVAAAGGGHARWAASTGVGARSTSGKPRSHVAVVGQPAGCQAAGVIGGCLLLVAACILFRGRSKRSACPPEEKALPPESLAGDFAIRSFSKRQALLRALMTDPELMTQSRIQVPHLMTRELSTIPPDLTPRRSGGRWPPSTCGTCWCVTRRGDCWAW